MCKKNEAFYVQAVSLTKNVPFCSVHSHLSSESKDEPREIKVGVIGCGRIGIVHLGAITKAPNVVPVIVSNPTVAQAEAGKQEMMLLVA